MPEPLSANYRVVFEYTVDGLLHRTVQYANVVVTTGGDPTGYDIVDRDGVTNHGASVAIDRWWSLMVGVFDPTKTTVGAALIQKRVGTAWTPLVAYAPSAVTFTGGGYVKASQMTVSMRSIALHRIKLVILEAQFNVPGRFTGNSGNTALDNPMIAYRSGVQSTHNPYRWVKNRSDDFISATAAFIAVVFDLNDKVRRARDLQ